MEDFEGFEETEDLDAFADNVVFKSFLHLIIPVKFKNSLIEDAWKKELFDTIEKIIDSKASKGCKTILVNGVSDHVHCLFSFSPNISADGLFKLIKSKSETWVNKKKKPTTPFEWQEDYAILSCGSSDMRDVFEKIWNQETTHKTMTFKDECLRDLVTDDLFADENFSFPDLE